MIASIRTPAASASHEPSPTRTARIAELNKRVGSLQQALKVAEDMKPAELAGLRTNSISQDIVAATSQIEKIVLASQLARLSLQRDKQPAALDEGSDPGQGSDGSKQEVEKDTGSAAGPGRSRAPLKGDNAARDADAVGTPALEDALKAARERLSPEQRAAAQALQSAHRHGGAAAAGVISSTYRADSEKVQQINLHA